MSRSRRKTSIAGITTAKSDAIWKAKAARILRHRVKIALDSALDANQFAGKRWDAVNPYDAPKDGKQWLGGRHERLMRK